MDKICFELTPRQQDNKTIYTAKMRINDLAKNIPTDADMVKKIEHLEKFYKDTIEFCFNNLNRIKNMKNSKERIFAYWQIANKIREYLEVTENKGFFLNDYYKHFTRDIKISEDTFRRLLFLRKSILKQTDLDITKSWTYYTRRYCRIKKSKE